MCTVEATWGGPQTEDDLIENLIQNPPHGALSLVELVEDTQAGALVDLCVTIRPLLELRIWNLALKEP